MHFFLALARRRIANESSYKLDIYHTAAQGDQKSVRALKKALEKDAR